MTMTIAGIDHSGDYLGIEDKKIKKKKKTSYREGYTEGQPPAPFDKGDLREKQHCDMVIDTIVFPPLRFSP